MSKAIEFGIGTVACASTGNLANATAAQAAAAGLPAVILIPYDLEPAKILGTSIYGARVVGVKGTYDDVNRLCSEIAGKYGWGFVNVNLRPFYAEGSKSYAYEIAEQLGWRLPAHVVVPMAGGSLVTKIGKAFGEFEKLGLVAAPARKPRIHGAQAEGCAPIIDMVLENRDHVRPVKTPTSIAKSLAIGNPADGFYARQTIIGSGGWAAKPNDDEIIAAMRLLAETEGIFTETAGGVTLGAALQADRRAARSARTTGRSSSASPATGMKTQDPLVGKLPTPALDRPAPGRLRRTASDLDLRRRQAMATIRIPTPLRKLTAGQGRGHRDRQHDRRPDRQPGDAVSRDQGTDLRRQRPGPPLRQHLRQRRGHPLPQESRDGRQGHRRDLDRPGDRRRMNPSTEIHTLRAADRAPRGRP